MVLRGSEGRPLLATIAAGLTIMTLALILANIRFFDEGPGGEPLGPIAAQVSMLLAYVLAAVFVFLLILMALAWTRGRGMPEKGERSPGHSVLDFVLVLAFVGVLFLFSTVSNGQITLLSPGNQEVTEPPQGGASEPDEEMSKGLDARMVAIGFLIVIGILAVGIVLRFGRRRPVWMPLKLRDQEGKRAMAVVDRAMRDLHGGEDPRSVIVRTYQQMSRLVGGSLEEVPFLTPREVAREAHKRFAWPKRPTEELTSLFEEAWYSSHRLREVEKERALLCLREISESRQGSSGP